MEQEALIVNDRKSNLYTKEADFNLGEIELTATGQLWDKLCTNSESGQCPSDPLVLKLKFIKTDYQSTYHI